MSDRKYSKDHEWITVSGDVGTVGISDHAQEQLGDVVFVEVPEAGRSVEQGGEIATIESVKAASEVYSPVSGEVVEGNSALADEPALVNSDPYGKGWFYKIKLSKPGELDGLMDEAAYTAFLETLD
jgi:glycine cleavage system H protein